MPYVAPSTVSSGQTYTAAAHNIIVEDVIDHETRIVSATNTANSAAASVAAANPTGSIIEFVNNGVSTPSGYLVCNGQAVSRTTYAALFALIGTTYGSGDGTTTFNLPNIPSETQSAFQLDPIQPVATVNSANTVITVASPAFDNKIYVGGVFCVFQRGGSSSGIARFNQDGTYDTTFTPTVNNAVRSLLFDSSNNLYAFGDFTTANATTRNRAAKWVTGGSSLDSSWNPDINNTVQCAAIQSDGKILIGGTFTTVGGASQSYLARLNTNGTRDTSFAPTIVGSNVLSILVQPDGNILIGGTFTSVNGTARTNVARLTSTGTTDTTFNASAPASGAVNSLARQSNGQILMCGTFTNWTGATVPFDFGFAARVSSTGTIDETYKPLFSTAAYSVVIGSDGSHYYGGVFSGVGGFATPYLAKVSSSGVVDRDWCPAPNGQINFLSLDSQNRILIAGQHLYIGRPGGTVANFGSIASWGWNRFLPTTQKTIALIKT